MDGGKLQKLDIATQQQADDLEQRLRAATPYTVASVTRKPTKRTPPPPLITSTLQREAASRLGWGTKKTMQVAQQLYEGAGAGGGPARDTQNRQAALTMSLFAGQQHC